LKEGIFQQLFARLGALYGLPKVSRRGPLEELISTILSQNTNDQNRDRAFAELKRRFSDWEEIALAPLDALKNTIRVAGLAPTKAPRIQQALWSIKEKFGHFLIPQNMEPQELLDFLLSLPGVGPKTARCVLLFSYRYPCFPVDTHILRVGRRLGFIGERESAASSMQRLDKDVPPELQLPLHLLLIEHGRRTCRPKPACALCPLRNLCPFYLGKPLQ